MTLSTTTLALGAIIFLMIISMLRKGHLHLRYTIWWLAVALAALVFGVFPKLFDSLAAALGVSYPPSLLFGLSIAMLLVRLLALDIDRTRQENRIRQLTQRLAIHERLVAGPGGEAKADLPDQESQLFH